jgi:hypothetical protein
VREVIADFVAFGAKASDQRIGAVARGPKLAGNDEEGSA